MPGQGYPSTGPARPVEELLAQEAARRELFAGVVLVHPRCGRPASEHPHPAAPEVACPFPAAPPVEFAIAGVEPVVRVCGIPNPGDLPRPVVDVLIALAETLRDHYGLGVEVEAEGEREAAVLALETIRRYLA
jgi:hypothetical protein